MLSGYFIEGRKQLAEGAAVYDFSAIRIFWVAAACCSLALLLASLGPIRQLPDVMCCYRVAERPQESATDKLYRLNRDHVADDYEYTKKLERYAAETLGADAGFEDHVCELLVSALAQTVKAPSGEHFALLRRILRENDAARSWAKAPAVTLKKIKDRL